MLRGAFTALFLSAPIQLAVQFRQDLELRSDLKQSCQRLSMSMSTFAAPSRL